MPTNIAEGCGRNTNPDFARFLEIAYGSANEVDYLLLLAKDLAMIDDHNYNSMNSQLVEIKKMLSALIRKIRNSNKQ